MFTSAFLGIASLIISAASTAYGIVSSIQQANAQAKLQAQQAKAQATSLREQAKQEEQDQIQRSLVARRQMARRVASAEASYASSGVSLAGTPTLSLASMAEEQEMGVLMQEASSNRKRELLLTDAYNTENFGVASASANKSAGYINAIGSGLSGTANLMGKGYNYGKQEGYI